jgi:cytidylate kinase
VERREPDSKTPVLAVDGPSGSGKGTISRRLAQVLGWHLLDSGALYRLVALAAADAGVALDDRDALPRLAAQMRVEFGTDPDREHIRLAGRDVTAAVRDEAMSAAASQVAALAEVRGALLKRQRAFAILPGLVADGRDMGTVVFPGAVLKVFLTASPQERARRRYKQLKEKGIDVSLPALSEDIAARDRRDTERKVAPLRPANDARVLDSTALTPKQVADQILAWLAELGFGPGSAREG